MKRLPLLKDVTPSVTNVYRTEIVFFKQTILQSFGRINHQTLGMESVPVSLPDEGLLGVIEE